MTSITSSPLAHQQGEISRAKWLKAQTHDVHDRLDASITSRDTFKSVQGYAGFLAMQYRFHRDIDALYHDPALQRLVPDLATRRRLPLIVQDMQDLGIAASGHVEPPLFSGQEPVDTARGLGWLYVAEGSNMGAALLRKEVARIGLSDTHGARHLASAPEGPAAYWRAFTQALDAARLDEAGDARLVDGAKAAFAHVQALAHACVG